MNIFIVTYLLCVVMLLALYIYFFVTGEDLNGRPWYWHALLIVFAPITFVAAVVIFIRDEYKHRHSPEYKAQASRAKLQERKELQRQATLALYHQRYVHQLTEVPASFIHTAHSLHSAMRAKQYTSILSHLNRLTLPEGESLFVRLPSSKHDCGDASRLYIASSIYRQESEFSFLLFDGNQEPAPLDQRKYKIFRHIRVEDSIVGAWQALLLSQLWHVLPYWWHGGYDHRRYIFTSDDLMQLYYSPRHDSEPLTIQCDKYHVAPQIVATGQGAYYITWCYWTEWGGLIRETYQVTIQDGRSHILHLCEETLFEYDCGIMF